jgi:Uma2 family endonuclease
MTIASSRSQTNATARRMTLEEYLTYDDGTDTRYELVDGVLVEMGTESTINTWIAIFLIEIFRGLGVPRTQIGIKQKIEVDSAYASARDPDLMIHSEASALAIEGRKESCLFLNEPNPVLAIEVASPGTESSKNYKRDYKQKPAEYAKRGIPEYWIIDPDRAVIKIGTLTDGSYQFQDFTGNQVIQSLAFPGLKLTAAEVLTAGC